MIDKTLLLETLVSNVKFDVKKHIKRNVTGKVLVKNKQTC